MAKDTGYWPDELWDMGGRIIDTLSTPATLDNGSLRDDEDSDDEEEDED